MNITYYALYKQYDQMIEQFLIGHCAMSVFRKKLIDDFNCKSVKRLIIKSTVYVSKERWEIETAKQVFIYNKEYNKKLNIIKKIIEKE